METSWWKFNEAQDIDTKYLLITKIKKSTSGEAWQTTPQSNNEN